MPYSRTGFSINPYLEFNITDHLGNVRVRYVDKNGDGSISVVEGDEIANEIIGSYHYYPFDHFSFRRNFDDEVAIEQ